MEISNLKAPKKVCQEEIAFYKHVFDLTVTLFHVGQIPYSTVNPVQTQCEDGHILVSALTELANTPNTVLSIVYT
jgi:hypothetical protein